MKKIIKLITHNLSLIILLIVISYQLSTINFCNAQWFHMNQDYHNDFCSVYFLDVHTGYIADGNGSKSAIYKTTDGGNHWEITKLTGIYGLSSVFFINKDTGYISGFKDTNSVDLGIVLKTINAGKNWTLQRFDSTYNLISIYFTDKITGYVIDEITKIFKTTDGGQTWNRIFKDDINYNLQSIFFVNKNVGFAAGYSTNNGKDMLIKTTDAGKNWFHLSSGNGGDYNSIFFLNENIGFTIGDFIFKTTDGGNTWLTKYLTGYLKETELISVYFTDINTGYAVGYYETILKTTDGGLNWNIQNRDTTKNNFNGLLSVYFPAKDTGYAVGGYGTILKTTNGGETWIKESIIKNNNYRFNICPNPAVNTLNIEAENNYSNVPSTLQIFNLQGKELLNQNFYNYKQQINIRKFNNGIYIIKITINNIEQAKKFIKMQ